MPEPDLLARYNSDAFVPAKLEPWLNFAGSSALGEPAPDFPIWSLDGGVTRLSAVWASHAYAVVEFGSLT